ncbi:MAG TPA: glycosyltransferase family A protein [Puia sp.]|jgi:glycosyltransferase involved in cell wall biosynthesis|nr:glycosyltransferase family A protein [Puia sp.]
MEAAPLISCLCVTRGKPKLLSRAIECFMGQSYSRKEMVLVYEDDDPETKKIASGLNCDAIRCIEVNAKPKLTLGELRNLAIHESRGELFCQWDDDDWYHSQRLEMQMGCIKTSYKPACVLVNWIIFDQLREEAYCSNTRAWEGSLLCRKDIINKDLKYDSLVKGEDTGFISKMLERKYLFPLIMPTLYIYVYHGNNTWNGDHFSFIFNISQKLPKSVGLLIADILRGKYAHSMASKLLSGATIMKEFDYFHSFRK